MSQDAQFLCFMISILAIIIALSIAYNFFSVWKSDKKIERLEKANIDMLNDLDVLRFQIARNDVHGELITKDSEVSDNYRNQRWLIALQREFEIVYFICLNYEYFKDEFQGKIGFKRSSIAKILLEIGANFGNTDLVFLRKGEININDIQRSIIAQWALIERSTQYALITQYEEKAYEELFLIADELIRQIKNGLEKLIIPPAVIEKLQYYKTKF